MLAWTLTDGSAEDETRCLGVAEAVADRIERRRIAPRAVWRWLAPFGPIDPHDAPSARSDGPITPKRGWPELVVATGRCAVPYLRALKRASGGRVVTAFLGETIAGGAVADVVAVTSGSRLTGGSVVKTPARPHTVSAVRLIAARGAPGPFAELPGPRVGVLPGRRPRPWSDEDVIRLLAGLQRLRDDGANIALVSGRGSDARVDMAARDVAYYVWERQGQDPTVRLLAHAEALVVAADDLLALDQAVMTGVPVLAFRPSGLDRRATAAVDHLASLGVVRPFAGRLEHYAYTPIDSTAEIARAISAVVTTRAALAPRLTPRVPTRSRETNGPSLR